MAARDRKDLGSGAWPAADRRRNIFVLGERFGNVFVGIQPAFGYEGDPMRLLFEHGFAPTHAFAAFYRWLQQDFAAHAVLHFGTHGALEFMPGKQAGMSEKCWPDRLIGDLPNYYLYASNNPSEGTLAKRRVGATLVSYMTPPVTQAGLYRGLLDLKASIDRWRALEPEADSGQRGSLATLIQAQASAVDLAPAEPEWTNAEASIVALGRAVLDLEYTLIPHGLHVVGEPPHAAARGEMLDAAGSPTRSGEPPWMHCLRPTMSCRRWSTRSTAATYVPPRAAISSERPRSCRPGATCMGSIRSASRARSRCGTVPVRPTGCSRGTRPRARVCPRPSRWCCGALTT